MSEDDEAGSYKDLLGAALKEWRTAENLTQTAAGELFDVSAGAFSSWERAKSWPQTAQRTKLRVYFELVPEVLRALDEYESSLRLREGRRSPHTGAVWSIQAKKDDGNLAELGDLGGQGYLIARLKKKLPNLKEMQEIDSNGNNEPSAEVVRMVPTGRSDEIACVFELHEYGVRSVVTFDDGPRDRLPRNAQTIEAMVVVRAGKKSRTGYLAVHFAHARGAKVTVGNEIEQTIRKVGLTPVVKAAGTETAVREALLENRVKAYRFVAIETPTDRFPDEKVKETVIGRIETSVYPPRGSFLKGGWLTEFLDGKKRTADFDRVVTFDEKQYDKASVVVRLKNGRDRTVNVTEADENVGHAITYDLTDANDRPLAAEASDAELLAALDGLLDDHET